MAKQPSPYQPFSQSCELVEQSKDSLLDRHSSVVGNPFFNSTLAPLPNPSPACGRGTKSQTITLARKRERVRDSAGEGQIWFISLNFKQFITALRAALVLTCSLPVFSAEITYFYDGDTVKIDDAGYEYRLRITDIDAPERNQTYGKKSRRALMDFCTDANIYVAISGTDRYGRKLGKLLCNQQDVSMHMVKYGHAWFNHYYSMDYSLALLQDEARKNKLGLWEAQQQTPPWVWRKNHLY